jgi:hypothetical protein
MHLTSTLASCFFSKGSVLAMHFVKGCWVLGTPPLQELLGVVQPVSSVGIQGICVQRQPRVCASSAGSCKSTPTSDCNVIRPI